MLQAVSRLPLVDLLLRLPDDEPALLALDLEESGRLLCLPRSSLPLSTPVPWESSPSATRAHGCDLYLPPHPWAPPARLALGVQGTRSSGCQGTRRAQRKKKTRRSPCLSSGGAGNRTRSEFRYDISQKIRRITLRNDGDATRSVLVYIPSRAAPYRSVPPDTFKSGHSSRHRL